MKLIVGLGNPGEIYKITRHNIGFMVIDHYINDNDWKTKWNSLYYEKTINNEKVIFIKPLTYMNLSGNAVAEYVNFYKLNLSDILIIQDDLDLKIGTYRLKNNSSDGGHNGIKSIIDKLGTKNFTRLKIGISKDIKGNTKEYVLGKFSQEEMDTLDKLFPLFDEIITSFILNGIEKTMNKYNGKRK